MCTTYILQSESTGKFYIGATVDIERRVREHNTGQEPYTRGRGPWRLVHRGEFPGLKLARRRERQIKSWKSHRSIEQLIAGG